jgi:ADP-ribosyl-[dinitrogen reductase] hydrolase
MLTIPERTRIMFALACADALGAATEFKTEKAIAKKYPEGIKEYVDGSPFGFKAGEATDDTQMTVAMVAGLHEGGAEAVKAHFQNWLSCHPPDVGGLTRAGINEGGWNAWARTNYDGAGNGGIMRAAGVNIAGTGYTDLSGLAILTARVTALTHIDPRCILSSIYLTTLIECLGFYGSGIDRAITDALGMTNHIIPDIVTDLIYERHVPAEARGVYATKMGAAMAELNEVVKRGSEGFSGTQSGYTMDTLQAALAHNVKGKDWLEVAEAAAMLGNDSDTAGAVAGAVAGARGAKYRPDEYFLDNLRIGATWGDWQRKWITLNHLPAIVAGK